MTGPEEPGDDWAFPEVATPASADPTSVELPADSSEQVYDTGSDAWWRQQAEAQRRAAGSEPPLPPSAVQPAAPAPPPELIEPTLLVTPPRPTPLDRDWLAPDLPELRAPEISAPEPAEPEPEEPEHEEPLQEEPVYEPSVYEEPVTAERPTERLRPPVEDLRTQLQVPLTRPPHEGERVGPARAVAGALLAVAGVALGIGALFLYSEDDSKQNGAVIEPRPSASAAASSSPTTGPTTAPTPEQTSQPSAGPTSVVVAPPTVAPTQAPLAPVQVLNNSKITGLAERGAAKFRAGGWTVSGTGNYRGGTIAQTTVYYAPGQLRTAQRFAKQFGIPRILPRFAGLPGSGMTVVLTRTFQ